MGVYISKKAIEYNPFHEREIDVNEIQESSLKSPLLNLNYLQEIVLGREIAINVNNKGGLEREIVNVKLALNIIDYYVDFPEGDDNNPQIVVFDIPNGPLETTGINAGTFDIHLQEALIAYQNFMNIPITGEIDAQTLSKIDAALDNQVVSDTVNNRIIGKKANTAVKIVLDSPGNNIYTLTVNGKEYLFQSQTPLIVNPIIDNSINPSENVLNISAKESIKLIDDTIEQKNIDNPVEIKVLKDAEYIGIKTDNLSFLSQPDQEVNDTTLQNETDITPPKILPEKHVRLHLVEDGDTLLDLITEEYYTNDSLDLTNPFDDNASPVYTFPARELNPKETREYDARLQFYINLIYYYNTPEVGLEGNYTEYGIIKANDYNRYNDDHLNNFNIFDNVFDPNSPESVFLNYYRFLKAQEQNGSTITFDVAGNPTSFDMVSGKNVWIPSREFAETLYYQMNFRHAEMLTQITEIDYLSETATNELIKSMEEPSIWQSIENTVGTAVDFILEETITAVREIIDFHIKIYEFAKTFVASTLWRGFGKDLNASAGVTWGYPIATDIKGSFTLWRKMTSLDELTFVFRQDFEAFVGLDTGIGGSIGFKFGNGKKKKKTDLALGLGATAGFRAGFKPHGFFEYELPLRKGETGILMAIANAFTGYIEDGSVASSFLSSINIANLDPRNYLTHSRMGIEGRAEVWGAAQLGFETDNNDNATPKEDKNVNKSISNTQIVSEDQDKGWLNIDNIWSKLPGIGISNNLTVALGKEIEYKAEYNVNPMVPERNGRIPSKVTIENFYYGQAVTITGAIGSMLQRMLFSATPLGAFLNLFANFNQGIGIGTERIFTRTSNARDMQSGDVNYANASANSVTVTDSNKGGIVVGNDNGNWESLCYLAHFSGDVDAMFLGGSEVKLKFELHKIRQEILNQSNFFDFNNIDDVLRMFYSVEIHTLPALLYNSKRSVIASTLFSKVNTIQKGSRRDLLQVVTKRGGLRGVHIYAGANVNFEIKLANVVNAFKYFIKRWMLMLKAYSENTPEAIKEWQEIKNEIEEKVKSFNKEIPETVGDTKIANRAYYEALYPVLDQYLKEKHDALDTLNYKQVASECLLLAPRLLRALTLGLVLEPITTLQDGVTKIKEDFKIPEFLKALTTLGEYVETTAALDARLGVEIGAAVNVALGAKVRGSLAIGGGLMYKNEFIEGNIPVQLTADDELKPFIDELNKITNTSLNNQHPEGIRQAFNTL